MQVIIIEDEELQAKGVEELCREWAVGKNLMLGASRFAGSQGLTDALLQGADIFFLDIQLGTESGMELAARIRAQNPLVPIVFITDHSDYVFEGYRVDAYRYLLKPLSAKDCADCLERALAYSLRKGEEGLLIPQKSGLVRIPLNSLLYLEAQGHRCRAVSTAGEACYTLPFSSLLAQLPKGGLTQCHRSYIVNTQYVTGMAGGQLRLIGGLSIPYSRSYSEKLLRILLEGG